MNYSVISIYTSITVNQKIFSMMAVTQGSGNGSTTSSNRNITEGIFSNDIFANGATSLVPATAAFLSPIEPSLRPCCLCLRKHGVSHTNRGRGLEALRCLLEVKVTPVWKPASTRNGTNLDLWSTTGLCCCRFGRQSRPVVLEAEAQISWVVFYAAT